VNDVKIGKGCLFKGSIKSYGKLTLEENVTIYGNVFTDGDILIGRNARISGHVFSQMSIHISGQTVISNPDKIKSVIGKKFISIEEDVIIYGYVATEGEGRTV
jgi:cytoskeletal protein CcmA (bactofilin family)